MTLAAGSKLGPYEILAPLGAGGMGEVYRAKDPRLSREVAIKVLPASFSADADRLRRFEQEAKAAGVLNHPNITAIYDIGTNASDGAPYVVQELLEGETLRAILAGGRLAPRRAIDYAVQIARGLAAAHEKGIIHRDLKPENLFVVRDGRVKILDFGLAKLTHQEEGAPATSLPTATAGTEPGVVMGTLGYMSPEQVRGKPADARSDIFSLGAVLYEMLAGQRAFRGDSAADTMSAILREDPPDLSLTNQSVSPGLERIVRHCLEKNPEERFHSAHDLAFDLEALSTTSPASGAAKAVSDARRTGMGRSALAAAAAAALALAFYGGTRMHPGGAALDNVQFRRLTFRRGNIMSARFAPDGQTVVFGAAWEGKPAEIFTLRVDSPESRPFGLPKADVAAVSSHGELAALLVNRSTPGELGTLARLPLGGGAPREVLEKVSSADFSPDGKDLAVIREMPDGKPRLEFPIGHTLYDAFYIFRPRVSPSGDLVAFQARAADGTTAIRVADRRGQSREISVGMVINSGIAWSPDGKEIVTSGRAKEGEGEGLYAIDLSGKKRMLLPGTGLILHDVAHDGRILIERTVGRTGILVGTDGGGPERDLGWLDQSVLGDISEDRRALLITEVGEGGGAEGTVYLRPIDGGAAVRLGEGEGTGLTPDGKWALTMRTGKPLSVFLLPTGPGSPRPVPLEGVDPNFAVLMTDGKHIGLYIGQPGQPPQLAIVGLEGGKPKPFALPGMSATRGFADSPGMRSIAYADANGKVLISDGSGAPPRTVPGPGLAPDEHILRWTDDPRKIFLSAVENLEGKFFKLDIATGEKTPWKTFHPADPSGVFRVGQGWLTPDGKTYAYSYLRVEASDLYEVRGLLPGRH